MGDEVEAGAECVRDHCRRTCHPERLPTDTEAGSTINRTLSIVGVLMLDGVIR